MKLVVTGATGFIGQEVLRRCVADPGVASVVVLARRRPPAPEAAHPKVEVVLLDDFLDWGGPAVLAALRGAQACIWALGMAWMNDLEEAKKVSLDYTMAAARAFTQHAVAEDGNTSSKVRFVYLSGGAAERDQEKSLWMLGGYRKIRGQVETELIGHARRNPGSFETHIVRPGFVLKKEFNLRDVARGLMPSVKVDTLAKALVDVAVHGFPSNTLENSQILEIGQHI